MVNARVWEVESSFPKGWPILTQHCKCFATTSTSTQVTVLPWRYDAEIGTANSLRQVCNLQLARQNVVACKDLWIWKR